MWAPTQEPRTLFQRLAVSQLFQPEPCARAVHFFLTAAMIVNVTVFPTNLVSCPAIRFMFCSLAYSISAEKVNHELLSVTAIPVSV